MALRYLVDTCAFVWALVDPAKLAPNARAILSDQSNDILVSAASAYEIVYKHGLGKWPEVGPIAAEVDGWVWRVGFDELPITFRHTMLAGTLVHVHRDPFDRIIAAQALSEKIALITRDAKMARFGVEVVAV